VIFAKVARIRHGRMRCKETKGFLPPAANCPTSTYTSLILSPRPLISDQLPNLNLASSFLLNLSHQQRPFPHPTWQPLSSFLGLVLCPQAPIT